MNLFGSKIFIIKYLKELMNIFYSLKYTNEFLILNKCSVLFLFSPLCVCFISSLQYSVLMFKIDFNRLFITHKKP